VTRASLAALYHRPVWGVKGGCWQKSCDLCDLQSVICAICAIYVLCARASSERARDAHKRELLRDAGSNMHSHSRILAFACLHNWKASLRTDLPATHLRKRPPTTISHDRAKTRPVECTGI
jgi:hypothetical protein